MSGSRVVIVGATSGIGLAVAEILAAEGCTLGLAGRHTASLAPLCGRYADSVVAAEIDVTSPDAPARLCRLADRLGGMDVYIHVSGVGFSNPGLLDEPDEATVDVNVAGFTRMVSAAYRYFVQNGDGGQIAAITSVAATRGIASMAGYSASKSYQQSYLEALAQMARNTGRSIRISDIRPGWVRTPLVDDSRRHPMMMELPRAARLIVRSLRRDGVSVVDWRWRVLTWLWRLVPRWVWVRLNVSAFTGGSSGSGVQKL